MVHLARTSQLESFFSEHLGSPILLALCKDLPSIDFFNEAEQKLFATLSNEHRKKSWLQSRAALKDYLDRTRHSQDTSEWKFPNPLCSLSHTRNCGGVAGLANSDGRILGVGLDMEILQGLKVEASRFFMQASEMEYVFQLPELDQQKDEALRIWTVKEALFKSDPDNKGINLREYLLFNPGATVGKAQHPSQPQKSFHYVSTKFEDHWITVALCKKHFCS